ncbi:MAG TPA: T9SS type A sorting domain-containing protein [Paludibacter sp.]|nr:T9SS type A sorting domain-containing protein [Paludibacter sp.]
MKNFYITFTLLLIFCVIVKSQVSLQNSIVRYDSDGNERNSSNITKKVSALKSLQLENSYGWDSIRPLTEINVDTLGGGYPYISPDGLRLYFTKGAMPNVSLYYVSRTNIYSTFTNRQLVSSNFPLGSMGCWFTNDELEIFYRKNDSIFYSSRSTMDDAFSKPKPVNLNGFTGSIQGISFTPDKKELYFNHLISSTNYCTLKFTNTGVLSYTLTDTLHIPVGFSAKPGSLSKDGLKYLVSLQDISGTTKLYQFSRNSLTNNFENPSLINNNVNDSYKTNGQSTVTSDENTMVWVKNNNGRWSGNVFYIAFKRFSTNISDVKDNNVYIYPNPAGQTIFLEGLNGSMEITIYSLKGDLMLNKHLDNNHLDISSMTKGIYMIRITNNEKVIIKKLIKYE